jgi:hypothetical protein
MSNIGKTTLVTYIYENAPIPPNTILLYCLCSYGFARSEANISGLTFRSLIAQLIRKERNLLPYVYDNVKTGAVPSATTVKDLLKDLIRASGPTFLIIDGLDECEGAHQRQLLSDLRAFRGTGQDQVAVKFLICSRETKEISAGLKKVPQVFLTEEKVKVSKDIAIFAKDSLSPLRERFNTAIAEEVEQTVVKKADGKENSTYCWSFLLT